VRDDQRWALTLRDDVCHRESLPGSGNTQKRLVAITLPHGRNQLFNRLRLISRGFVVALSLKGMNSSSPLFRLVGYRALDCARRKIGCSRSRSCSSPRPPTVTPSSAVAAAPKPSAPTLDRASIVRRRNKSRNARQPTLDEPNSRSLTCSPLRRVAASRCRRAQFHGDGLKLHPGSPRSGRRCHQAPLIAKPRSLGKFRLSIQLLFQA
jgi:hypothetical protein